MNMINAEDLLGCIARELVRLRTENDHLWGENERVREGVTDAVKSLHSSSKTAQSPSPDGLLSLAGFLENLIDRSKIPISHTAFCCSHYSSGYGCNCGAVDAATRGLSPQRLQEAKGRINKVATEIRGFLPVGGSVSDVELSVLESWIRQLRKAL